MFKRLITSLELVDEASHCRSMSQGFFFFLIKPRSPNGKRINVKIAKMYKSL